MRERRLVEKQTIYGRFSPSPWIVPAIAALVLSGCTAGTAAHSGQTSGSPPEPTATTGTIAYSTASGQTVQPQPAPGSCHSIGSSRYSRPDPRCTPGALNPAVTQATIGRTICRRGWTETIRPPERVTEPEKAASMAAYGESGPRHDYEYDHVVPLELGGAVNDPRNLWPEPGTSPNLKDAVEDDLRQKVCDGLMTLAQAQRGIATNWVTFAAAGG
jgi:hypothetical protein